MEHHKLMMQTGGSDGPYVQTNFLITPVLPNWLSLSRASHAMNFDSTGKLTWAPNNILTNSDDFTVSGAGGWGLTNLALSTGADDPFGGTSAYLLTNNGGAGSHFIARVSSESVVGPDNMFSICAKAGTANFIHILHGSTNIYAQFNLSTGALVYSGGSTLVAYGATSLGGGWFRFYIKIRTTLSSFFRIYPLTASQNVAGPAETSSATVSIYQARLSLVTYETSPSAADDVSTTSAAYNGPRFDYNADTLAARGLLLEGARTNVVLWNRDLTNAAWTKTNVAAAKDQTGIDGVASSASKITASAGNGTCLQAITLASSARLQSAYVKRVTGSGVVEMTTDNGATWTAVPVTASWTRVTISAQTLANPTVGFRIVTSGDAIAVDFVQNENGAFASSPTFTTSAAFARAFELPTFLGVANTVLAAGSAGTIVAQFATPHVSSTNAFVATNTASRRLFYTAAISTEIVSYNGTNTLTATIGGGGAFGTNSIRVVLAWDAAGRALLANNGTEATDAFLLTADTTAYLGSDASGTSNLFGWTEGLSVYNVKLAAGKRQEKSIVGSAY